MVRLFFISHSISIICHSITIIWNPINCMMNPLFVILSPSFGHIILYAESFICHSIFIIWTHYIVCRILYLPFYLHHLDTLYCMLNPLFAILSPSFGHIILYAESFICHSISIIWNPINCMMNPLFVILSPSFEHIIFYAESFICHSITIIWTHYIVCRILYLPFYLHYLDTLYCMLNPLFSILSPSFGHIILYDESFICHSISIIWSHYIVC